MFYTVEVTNLLFTIIRFIVNLMHGQKEVKKITFSFRYFKCDNKIG